MSKKTILVSACLVLLFLCSTNSAQAIPERGDVLSSISFELDNSTNTQNARVAVNIVNGKVLQPGEEFSFNNTTGRRTTDKGFIAGHYPVRENGRIVDYSVIGSGVCRASTGVHYAALEAGLKITEAWRHSVPVDYVPYGKDAAVNWGDADLRFINNKTYPIRIVIMIGNDNILRAQIIRAY